MPPQSTTRSMSVSFKDDSTNIPLFECRPDIERRLLDEGTLEVQSDVACQQNSGNPSISSFVPSPNKSGQALEFAELSQQEKTRAVSNTEEELEDEPKNTQYAEQAAPK